MDKFISMWKVREIADKVTNVVMNYTEIEGKVREATNDDPWGPTGVLMQELAHATFTYEHFPEVMSMLWRRMLQDNKTNWRRTYKATLLLSYLVKNGSERVVTSAREHIYDLRSLENYTFVDDNGKDQGVNVRHKVRDLIEFIQDDDRLREERKKAKKNKDKYIGMSSDAMGGMKSFDDFRNRESFNTSKNHEEKGYSDQTEYDYQYEYERGDDSDTESSGNKNAKRYRDKERSSSPTIATATASAVVENVVTTPPTFKADDKKPISVKAPVSIMKTVGTTASSARTTKKGINMGAASNYGKNSDLGINSPTHRNTHNEDLFGTSDVSTTKTKSIIEDIFNDAADDFDPRAEEPVAPKVSADFGDFESAFGNEPQQAPIKTSTITAKPVVDSDFADFSSAFDSSKAAASLQQSTASNPLDNDNFLFSSSPQPTVASATIMPQTISSNNNLLSADLFGNSVLTSAFTASQATSNKDLLSDFGDLTLNPTTQVNRLNTAHADLMSNLQSIDVKINSTEQLEAVLRKLKVINEILPSASRDMTNLMACNESVFEHYASEVYPIMLTELLFKCGDNLEDIPQEILKLIQITNNVDFIVETMNVLCNAKSMDKCMKFKVRLLEYLLRDESYLLFSIIRLSHNELDHMKWMKIEHYIQQLISIPDKIANRMKSSFPQVFEIDVYSSILLINVLKSIHVMIHINGIEQMKIYEFNFVTKLISKMLVNFKSSSTAINCAIKILSTQAAQAFYQNSLQDIVKYLQRGAIEIIVQQTFGYEERKGILIKFFGDFWKSLSDWNYILTKKIPFYNFTSNDLLIENVVFFIATEDMKILEEILLEMLVIWGTKSHVHDTSFEQHFYVTKFIVLMTSYLQNPKEMADKIRQHLFNGAQIHLSSTDPKLRALGMITSEVVIGFIDFDIKEEEKLKFEYGELDRNIKEDIVDVIRHFPQRKVNKEDLKEPIDVEIDTMMNELIAVAEMRCLPILSKPQVFKISEIPMEITVKPQIKPAVDLDSDDDDLPTYIDKDDDFNRNENQPRYILDIIQTLSSKEGQESVEKFESIMNLAQDIIKQQLPSNHVDIAVDLLRIFISLQKTCYCENFEELRMNILIETCCIHPKECAQYIGNEFNTDITKYSLRTRMLMLDILCESAKQLSKLSLPKKEEMPKNTSTNYGLNKLTIKLQEELDNRNKRDAQRIIKERLMSKTRRIASRTKSLDENSAINKFSNIAGYFFFPLIKGFGRQQMPFMAKTALKHDMDNILLVKFLNTVSILILCAENSTIVPKMAKEIVNLSVFLRYHDESQIRLAVLHMFSTIILAVPKNVLVREFSVELNEFMNHLDMIVRSSVVNYEPDKECREFAKQLMSMCYGALYSDSGETA
ncbi:unnamed protein product [Chironomus riparius]|uniref:ENTH domain-containing protein n=1 Tax=Chironomus riparius TaxID=315576 RepID=A0A9P0IJH7_9DIPT|nr:unnamed protein product [Chironomus riparius]